MRDQLQQPLSIGMIVLAAFVLISVFGGSAGRAPLLPSLAPFFGVLFGLIFAALQAAFCLYFDKKMGLLLLLGVWVVAVPLVYFTASLRFSDAVMSGSARAVTGAACASAILLGIAVLTGKL
jgi:hypothetical protein